LIVNQLVTGILANDIKIPIIKLNPQNKSIYIKRLNSIINNEPKRIVKKLIPITLKYENFKGYFKLLEIDKNIPDAISPKENILSVSPNSIFLKSNTFT